MRACHLSDAPIRIGTGGNIRGDRATEADAGSARCTVAYDGYIHTTSSKPIMEHYYLCLPGILCTVRTGTLLFSSETQKQGAFSK